jgi:hypothetical protein
MLVEFARGIPSFPYFLTKFNRWEEKHGIQANAAREPGYAGESDGCPAGHSSAAWAVSGFEK